MIRSAHSKTVIIIGSYLSSNPWQSCIVLIPLVKAWIQLFFLQVWINCRTDCFSLTLVWQPVKKKELWIHTSCRPGEGWALPDYTCPRCTRRVAPQHLNQGTEPVNKRRIVMDTKFILFVRWSRESVLQFMGRG